MDSGKVLVFVENIYPCCKEFLKLKYEELKKRIWKCTLISGIGGAVPVPGVSAVIDLSILGEEYMFQQKMLKIDGKSLQKKARILGMTNDSFIQAMLDESPNNFFLKEIRKKLLKHGGLEGVKIAIDIIVKAGVGIGTYAAKEAGEEAAKYLIPVVGSVIASAISASSTYALLHWMLSNNFELAQSYLKVVEKKLGNK